MLSNIRYPAFKSITKSAKGVAVVATLLFTIALLGVFWRLSLLLVIIGAAYIAYGLIMEILVHGPRRRSDDFMYLGSLEEAEEEKEAASEALKR